MYVSRCGAVPYFSMAALADTWGPAGRPNGSSRRGLAADTLLSRQVNRLADFSALCRSLGRRACHAGVCAPAAARVPPRSHRVLGVRCDGRLLRPLCLLVSSPTRRTRARTTTIFASYPAHCLAGDRGVQLHEG